jgi:hypothetical protein
MTSGRMLVMKSAYYRQLQKSNEKIRQHVSQENVCRHRLITIASQLATTDFIHLTGVNQVQPGRRHGMVCIVRPSNQFKSNS